MGAVRSKARKGGEAMARKTKDKKSADDADIAGAGEPEADISRVADELRSAAAALKNAATIATLGADRICPIFYEDKVYRIALPYADFDAYQRRLLETRCPPDPMFLLQLFDLLKGLEGRTIVDVGAYTGLTSVILAQVLSPAAVYLFEPQKVMAEALAKTIAANGLAKIAHFHGEVIGEEDQPTRIGANRADRLSDTRYLHGADGALRARSIDSFGLADVGMINLDFGNSKIPALRGAMETIASSRPVIAMDLTGRDLKECLELLSDHSYEAIRVGRHSALLLPS